MEFMEILSESLVRTACSQPRIDHLKIKITLQKQHLRIKSTPELRPPQN